MSPVADIVLGGEFAVLGHTDEVIEQQRPHFDAGDLAIPLWFRFRGRRGGSRGRGCTGQGLAGRLPGERTCAADFIGGA